MSLRTLLSVLLLLGAATPAFSQDQPPTKAKESAPAPEVVRQNEEPMVAYDEAAAKAVREARRKQIEAIKRRNGELDPCVIRTVMSDEERRICGIKTK